MAAREQTVAGMHVRDVAGRDPPVLLLHGFPETGHMWRPLIDSLERAGRRTVAPDLPGWGRSAPDPPHTWERAMGAVSELHGALGLGRVVLVVHDWGGLIGLRWACENPDAIAGLVISGTGFFADGRWSGMAEGLRSEKTGEQMIEGLDREGFAALMRSLGRGFDDEAIDEYWRGFAAGHSRAAALELYRSGDFEKIAKHDGALGRMGVPTLLLWGSGDEFAPVGGAHRFAREIPDSELVVLDDAGHFLWSDEPERAAGEVLRFLDGRGL